jgi:UDP-glucose 4-epimerase
MHVLVTGGAGFIGSHLVDALLLAGHRVRVLDNLSTGHRENLPAFHPMLDFVHGDIRDCNAVAFGLRGIDAVVHLAAVASVQASVNDPIGTHQTNLDGTLHLLEAAHRHGARRFVYASSAAVYGEAGPLPIVEALPPAPLSPYAIDKLAGEQYLAYFARRYDMLTTAFRFFNVYGPRQDPSSPYSGVISIFAKRIEHHEPITIFGDGTQTRDFVYVGDLVRVLMRALEDGKGAGMTLNLGTGIETSVNTLTSVLEYLAQQSLTVTWGPARHGDIHRSCADVTRLRKAFGMVPATPVSEGLRTLLVPIEPARVALG